MKLFGDIHNRRVRLSYERQEHIETDHPEMSGQIDKVQEVLLNPDIIVKSRVDAQVELFYRSYKETYVGEKHLCVVVKVLFDDPFIITAYLTDTIKGGQILWERK